VYTVIETPSFTRLWPDYWTEEERGEFVAWLALNNRLKDGVIYLLIMYAKGVKDSIPAKTLNTIRETING
jgi:hypothetical protein